MRGVDVRHEYADPVVPQPGRHDLRSLARVAAALVRAGDHPGEFGHPAILRCADDRDAGGRDAGLDRTHRLAGSVRRTIQFSHCGEPSGEWPRTCRAYR